MRIISEVFTKDDKFYFIDDNPKIIINGKERDGLLFRDMYDDTCYTVSVEDHLSIFKKSDKKGGKFGICNRTACPEQYDVVFYNKTTKGHYCGFCASRINASCKGESYFPLCEASKEDMIALHGERGEKYSLAPV